VNEVTKVDKPWGYELHWAKTGRYVGKLIHVNAGHALSLQYHNQKDETIFLSSGRMLFEIAAQPLHHLRGGVHALHADPAGPQRQRDPPRPDGQLQRRPGAGQAGQELHRGISVPAAEVLVVNLCPAVTVERGVIESFHDGYPTRPPPGNAT